MSYSDSTHFSEQNSYKILFISSYGLKDMNLARFEHLQQFLEKQKTHWSSWRGWRMGQEADWIADKDAGTFFTRGRLARAADEMGLPVRSRIELRSKKLDVDVWLIGVTCLQIVATCYFIGICDI
jgi:hypothetical protein